MQLVYGVLGDKTAMLEFSEMELTLEQEAVVRAAELEIDMLELEELRLCLKLATRSDLIKTNIIHQLSGREDLPKISRPKLARRVMSEHKKLVTKLRSW